MKPTILRLISQARQAHKLSVYGLTFVELFTKIYRKTYPSMCVGCAVYFILLYLFACFYIEDDIVSMRLTIL